MKPIRSELRADQWVDIGRSCRESIRALRRIKNALINTLPVDFHDQWANAVQELIKRSQQLSDMATDRGFPCFPLHLNPERESERPGRRKRTFTRSQWVGLGEEVKSVRRQITDLGIGLQSSMNKAQVRPWFNLVDRLDRLKARLDQEAFTQHPSWPEFKFVFYGPRLSEQPKLQASLATPPAEQVVD